MLILMEVMMATQERNLMQLKVKELNMSGKNLEEKNLDSFKFRMLGLKDGIILKVLNHIKFK